MLVRDFWTGLASPRLQQKLDVLSDLALYGQRSLRRYRHHNLPDVVLTLGHHVGENTSLV